MAAKQEFASRFAKHKDELEWLFMELYHNREGLEVLEREMAEAYNARSAELKALDKARSADPEWYKRGNMFGMTMYTDLFAGNLKELAKKLPYLKEQKLTYLHLMPLLQMPHIFLFLSPSFYFLFFYFYISRYRKYQAHL